MKDDSHFCEAPLSPARQAWLMLVVIAPMAACYSAIKAGLELAPSWRFAGLRTLVGGFGERLNALQGGGVALILLVVALSVFAGWPGPVP